MRLLANHAGRFSRDLCQKKLLVKAPVVKALVGFDEYLVVVWFAAFVGAVVSDAAAGVGVDHKDYPVDWFGGGVGGAQC